MFGRLIRLALLPDPYILEVMKLERTVELCTLHKKYCELQLLILELP